VNSQVFREPWRRPRWLCFGALCSLSDCNIILRPPLKPAARGWQTTRDAIFKSASKVKLDLQGIGEEYLAAYSKARKSFVEIVVVATKFNISHTPEAMNSWKFH
jgi:hypothetical protein